MRSSKFFRCPETITRLLVFWSQNLVFICAKSLQLCLTLCSSMDHSLSGCFVQARILEWVAFALLWEIFLTQRLNSSLLGLPHWHAGSLLLVPPGKPLRKKKPSSGLYFLSKNIKCRKVSWVFCLLKLYCCKTKTIVGLMLGCSVVSDSCNPMDYSPPGSSVHGISQRRTLKWVAITFSRGSSPPRDQMQVSYIARGFFNSWTTREAPYCVYVSLKYILKCLIKEDYTTTLFIVVRN